MRYIACIMLGMCIAGLACNKAIPIGASSTYIALHHDIPATFVGQETGPIVYLCATQPRGYDGTATEDHYLQYSHCPAVPIN